MITGASLGAWEIILIVIVAIVVLGPEKTPYYAKKLGEALGLMKQYSGKLATEIKENVAEPLSEVVQPLQSVTKEMTEPFKDLTDPLKEIKAPLNEATKAINDAVKVSSQPLKKAVAEAAADTEAAMALEAGEETALTEAAPEEEEPAEDIPEEPVHTAVAAETEALAEAGTTEEEPVKTVRETAPQEDTSALPGPHEVITAGDAAKKEAVV